MREPLVSRGPSEGWRENGCGCAYLLCHVWCSRRCLCGRFLALAFVLSAAVWIGITRNLRCNPVDLEGVEPPFAGELMPGNVTLVERKYFFQFTKLVDVYTEDMTHVGYFYDINLFVIMRFGFSDAAGRIWFEARYASFLSRFKPIVEYTLQRCDVGSGGRSAWLFEVKEDWLSESYWRCVLDCSRLFNISKREVGHQVMERLVPEAGFAQDAVARASFDARVAGTLRGKITGRVRRFGTGFRQQWGMNVSDARDGAVFSTAWQHFAYGTWNQDLDVLSLWQVRTRPASACLPNWVVGFLAVLDDLQEEVR